jgi:hypothetical protein
LFLARCFFAIAIEPLCFVRVNCNHLQVTKVTLEQIEALRKACCARRHLLQMSKLFVLNPGLLRGCVRSRG